MRILICLYFFLFNYAHISQGLYQEDHFFAFVIEVNLISLN